MGNLCFEFRDITMDVVNKTGLFGLGGKTTKRILHGITGCAMSGEMMYIMGPSGSGKTTLLNSLAFRTKIVPQGCRMLNGHDFTEAQFKRFAKYCAQEDHLYEALTVKETLLFSAQLSCTDNQKAREHVDAIVQEFGLQHQTDVKAGGTFFKGLSGGQRRRLSICEQLVQNPGVLVLNEPTSGLDSAAAYRVMKCLKETAKATGIVVIATIHQPSERVFELADALLLLTGGGALGGHQAYFGSPHGLEKFFEDLDQVGRPPTMSPVEWAVDIVNADFGEKALVEKTIAKSEQMKGQIGGFGGIPENSKSAYRSPNEIVAQMPRKANLCVEQSLLVARGFRNWLRNPAAIWLRFTMYMGLAFMIATVWWDEADSIELSSLSNILGVLFFLCAFMVFMSISVLPVYIEDRAITIKERSNNTFGLASLHISQFITTTPFVAFLAVCAAVFSYFGVGFKQPFGYYFLNLFLALLVAEGLCALLAAVVPIFIIAIAAGAFVFGMFMVVQGFFIKINDIPEAWRWVRFIALHFYSYGAFVQLELDHQCVKYGDAIAKQLGGTVSKDGCAPRDLVDDFAGDYEGDLTLDFSVMAGMIVAFRVLTFLAAFFLHKGKK